MLNICARLFENPGANDKSFGADKLIKTIFFAFDLKE
jgi:hypothetical protein